MTWDVVKIIHFLKILVQYLVFKGNIGFNMSSWFE